jgi:hypothetical protein
MKKNRDQYGDPIRYNWHRDPIMWLSFVCMGIGIGMMAVGMLIHL